MVLGTIYRMDPQAKLFGKFPGWKGFRDMDDSTYFVGKDPITGSFRRYRATDYFNGHRKHTLKKAYNILAEEIILAKKNTLVIEDVHITIQIHSFGIFSYKYSNYSEGYTFQQYMDGAF